MIFHKTQILMSRFLELRIEHCFPSFRLRKNIILCKTILNHKLLQSDYITLFSFIPKYKNIIFVLSFTCQKKDNLDKFTGNIFIQNKNRKIMLIRIDFL